jgi:hypothetical protein
MSNIMVRCPTTGDQISTGIETDQATFDRLPVVTSRLLCPACGKEHAWAKQEAWLDGGAPSASSPESPVDRSVNAAHWTAGLPSS